RGGRGEGPRSRRRLGGVPAGAALQLALRQRGCRHARYQQREELRLDGADGRPTGGRDCRSRRVRAAAMSDGRAAADATRRSDMNDAWFKDYPGLLFERLDHGVLRMTINRPAQKNATDPALHRSLSRVWLDIDDDPDVRVVVVTGAGDAFSAGGDL